MITREYLENRIQEFTAARDSLQADVAANNGAIQFCQHLLDTLAAEPEPEAVPVNQTAEQAEQPKANGEAPAP